MEDNKLFELVLDQDEQILKVLKPNKTRTWFTSILSLILLTIVCVPPIVYGCIEIENGGLATVIIMSIFYVVLFALTCLCVSLWLKKAVYAITTKRVLIRTGYIGVDFKSLDFTLLGAFTVNVGWIDKLLNKNTGSLSFGSMASPMINNQASKFNFLYIKNPYEMYKEIKSIIDQHKAN